MRMKTCSAFMAVVLAVGLCPAFAHADELQAVEEPLELPAIEQPEVIDVPAAKRFNTMSLRVSHKVVRAKDVKSAKHTLTRAVSVLHAQGDVEFSKPSKRLSKHMSVNKKTGAITVKKGTKADTYSVLVKVTASGDDTHLPMTKAALVRITVK